MKNPLRGLRFSLLDFHSARASTGMKIAMLGIALIPLIYGALYLMAFYDPYGRLDTLPVAVVNEDKPAYTDAGERITAGDDLVAKLKTSDALDWRFVATDAEAQAGLEDGTYYNKVVIPADFSACVASAATDDPHQARIVMVANEANNYLASILGASVMRQVTANANYAIGDGYYLEFFDEIDNTGESIAVAADGADELAEGLTDAHDGSATITDGLASADDGAGELAAGVARAADGAGTLADGLGAAASGADTLDRGLASLADGLAAGQTSSARLAASLHQLQTQGSAALASGTASLKGALEAQQGSVAQLSAGAAQVSGGIDELAATLGDLGGQVGAMGTAVSGLQAQLNEIEQQSGPSLQGLAAAGGSLQANAQAAAGTAQAATGSLTGLPDTIATLGSTASAAAGHAASAKDSASAAQGILAGLTPNDEGSYVIDAATYASLAGSVATAAGEAEGARQASAGAAAGLDTMGAGVEAMSGTIGTLAGQLDAVRGDLTTIASGAGGVADIASKSQGLIDGAEVAVAGARGMVDGVTAKMADVERLRRGAAEVAGGVGLVATQLSAGQDAGGNVTIYGAVTQLASGAAAVDDGMVAAAVGAGQLTTQGWQAAAVGAGSACAGAGSLKAGLGRLYAGSETLADGLGAARGGAGELGDGIARLRDGSATLTDGLAGARDGAGELAEGLDDGVDAVADATAGADARAAMMSEPVAFEEQRYTSVDNYGSGFAPYFIALGLWVGALVMTFILRPLNMRLVTAGAAPAVVALAGLVPWLIVSTIQAVALAATIQFACGISVAHPAAYYLLTVLASWVFCAAIQAVAAAFGFPGKFVAVVLLMLQLTTAAGTFPIQTEFPIFQALSPWLPMTYVVHALRMAMAGADLSLVGGDVAALVTFMAGLFAVTTLVAWRKRLVTMMDLHPLVNL